MAFSSADFLDLHTGNHRITSPADANYNCIAWAAGIDNAWWEPMSPSREYTVTSLLVVYESLGFVPCADGSLEAGMEKIAIFADGPEYMHAARQLENGKWTSKMGFDEDIEHDAPENLAGPSYGQVALFMHRSKSPTANAAGSTP